jgi:A/G-specific adenine glycosylase
VDFLLLHIHGFAVTREATQRQRAKRRLKSAKISQGHVAGSPPANWPDTSQTKQLRQRLLGWFRENFRELPWRKDRNPYRIWIAEVMLQQTRIAAVIPYYERFLKRFPRISELARAKESEVLRLWSGLGYYSRARYLHQAAQQMVAQHGGRFPHTPEEALALPGIGRYTAAAILSIAYETPLAAVDGNVSRVLARLLAIEGDPREPQQRRMIEEAAAALMDRRSPGDWNQAVMELGETICTPLAPQCIQCPVEKWCRARALGRIHEIPAKRVQRQKVRVELAAAVLLDAEGRTALVHEAGKHDEVIFSRMWQFPCAEVEGDAAEDLRFHLAEAYGIRNRELTPLETARHAVTYREITLRPFLCRMESLPADGRMRIVTLEGLGRLPVSSATRKIAHAALPGLAGGIQISLPLAFSHPANSRKRSGPLNPAVAGSRRAAATGSATGKRWPRKHTR